MAYRRFSNVEEVLGAFLSRRMMEGIQSRDFITRECNCTKSNKNREGGLCLHGGYCRKTSVAYEAKCLICKKKHIGNTQTTLKKRMEYHFLENHH